MITLSEAECVALANGSITMHDIRKRRTTQRKINKLNKTLVAPKSLSPAPIAQKVFRRGKKKRYKLRNRTMLVSRQHITDLMAKYIPTRKEIKDKCEEIRRGWTKAEHKRRSGQRYVTLLEVPYAPSVESGFRRGYDVNS